MKTLTETEKKEIAELTYHITPKNQGHPHDAGQSIWREEYAVLRRWDWDDDYGRLSNTRHEYSVYKWDGDDEDPYFQELTLGELVAEFTIPTKPSLNLARCSCCSRTYDSITGEGSDTGLGKRPIVCDWADAPGWGVICNDCGEDSGNASTRDEAVKLWNHLMLSQVPPDRIEIKPIEEDDAIRF